MKQPPPPPKSDVLTFHFIPADEPGDRLVVVLHGLGDSSAGFLWMPDMLAQPKVNYLLLNAPDPYFFMGFSWFDIMDREPGILRSRALLQQLLADLQAQGWKSENILLFGFSQGCLMAFDLAMRHPLPLAGVIGISGFIFLPPDFEQEITPQAPDQNWLMTHGTEDPMLPIGETRKQMETLKAAGIPIQWHEFHKEHTLDPTDEMPLLAHWIAERWKS